jgi:hypothetical protein
VAVLKEFCSVAKFTQESPASVHPRTFENGLIGTVAKAWRDCTIGHPGRTDCGTPQAVVEEIEQLRRQRWTGKQITAETGVSSPRFYVRRDVPMLQQIPPSFFIFRAPNLFGIQ